MAKKRKKGREEDAIQPKDILSAMEKAGRPLFMREITKLLQPGLPKRPVKEMILHMVVKGELLSIKEGRYGLPGSMNLVVGRIQGNPAGFAFLIPDDKERQDIFIPARDLNNAVHGDKVVVRLEHGLGGRRPEGRVIRILERSMQFVVGVFGQGQSSYYVQPEDERFQFEVIIPPEETLEANAGETVVAEITNFPCGRRNPEGKVVRVLGPADDLAVQTQIVIYKHGLTEAFGPEAEKQAGELPEEVRYKAERQRKDIRELLTVTIDGETARDFDDAVSIEKDRRGYNLYVSIADISHYVPQGTPLDSEAFKRSNSVYFPNYVIPMLPTKLSNHLGSLEPNVDRLAVTVLMRFDRKGNLQDKSFFKSVIRSDARLTYTEVRDMLVTKDRKLRQKYKPFLISLKWMSELCLLLRDKRRERGSIDFDLPEPELILNVQGSLDDIVRRERNLAHQIIEEFMIAANEAVASYLHDENLPSLYRVHQEPGEERIHSFLDFAYSLGLPIEFPQDVTAFWFQNVLGKVEGTTWEYIVNNLLLRSMKQAAYSEINLGHFGLASKAYTHFTSPIRRYADLIVHRILVHKITGKREPLYTEAELAEIGRYISTQERSSMDAEREIVERLRVRFMADKIGEEYDGIISAVTSFGFFVELKEIFVEGVVRLADLADDYYFFEEEQHRLVGKRKRKIFQIGDMVRVQVARVDTQRRHINFVVIMKYTATT